MKYLITFGIGAVVVLVYISIAGIFSPWQDVVDKTAWNIVNEEQKNYFILTNATFSVGVVCTALGLFVVAKNGGAFEMLTYGVRRFISLFQKDQNKIPFKTYYDYHVYKSSEPKKSVLYFIVVGVLYIGVSMIFLALYYGAA